MALEDEREKIIKEIWEKHKDEIYTQVLNKFVYGDNQKPFKCPVCEGTGCDIAPHEDACNSCCHPCKGTGIIWG